MKQCNEPNCTLPVFGGLKCKYHQHKRTDKPDKTKIKPVKPRSLKKCINTKPKQNNSFKASICCQWGFNTQKELFGFVWKTRPHICQFTGSDLDLVPKYQFHWMFLHILRKGTYRYYKYNPDNIVLGHPNFHLAADNFTEEERELHPLWDFDLWFDLVEKKKEEYKKFLKENML